MERRRGIASNPMLPKNLSDKQILIHVSIDRKTCLYRQKVNCIGWKDPWIGRIRKRMQFFKRTSPEKKALKETFSSLHLEMQAALKRLTELRTISLEQPVTWEWKKTRSSSRKRPRILRLVKTVSEELLMTLKTIQAPTKCWRPLWRFTLTILTSNIYRAEHAVALVGIGIGVTPLCFDPPVDPAAVPADEEHLPKLQPHLGQRDGIPHICHFFTQAKFLEN